MVLGGMHAIVNSFVTNKNFIGIAKHPLSKRIFTTGKAV